MSGGTPQAAPPGGEVERKRTLLRALLQERAAAAAPPAGERIHPTSFPQQRLWFLDRLVPGNPFYNVEAAIPLRAPALDPALLARAINAIVRRHEALRTTFREVDGQPVQVVAPELTVALPVTELRHLPPGARQEEQQRIRRLRAAEPFDLAAGPLLRTELLRLGAEEWLFLLHMHHIVADGWSMGVFSRELSALYADLASGRAPSLPVLPVQYGDWARWQRDWLSGPVLQAQLDHWRPALEGLQPLDLPTDRARPPVQSHRGAFHAFTIEAPLRAALEAIGRAQRATPFMVLLAGFKVLLARHCGSWDVAVGTYVANRDRAEIEGLIGFFLNTLVLRTRLDPERPFAAALAAVRGTALDAYAHQALPFERVVEALQPARDLSRNPLIQIAFQLQTAPTRNEGAAEGGAGALVDYQRGAAIFDIAVTLYPEGDHLQGVVEYATDLFAAETIEALARRYLTLLRAVAGDPAGRPVGALEVMDAEERHHLLVALNATARAHPMQRSVVGLFHDAAAAAPDAPAFLLGDAALSFRDLAARAERIAQALAVRGIRPGEMVGVRLPRGFDLPAAMLAVWKAGGVYVPLDPAYPEERLAFMARDSGARVVIYAADAPAPDEPPKGPPEGLGLLRLDEASLPAVPAGPPMDRCGGPEAAAHVIYTSGSTGRPKGVASPHRQVLNRLHWMWEAYPVAPGEVGSNKTSISFIDSLWELLGFLLRGAPTAILPHEAVLDPPGLVAALARHGVTRLWLVPSYLRTLLDSVPDLGRRLPRLGFWVASGEVLPIELQRRFERACPAAKLYNLYGTSEVWDATWHDPDATDAEATRVPIGRPIDNVEVFVLDERRRPVPTGAVGELWVAGAGLCRGFLNRPDVEAARMADLVLPGLPAPRRALACGDLVRWRRGDTLDYVGRRDGDVKLRGVRVAPAEIESLLMEHPAVARAAVVPWEATSGETRLAAFVVAADGAAPPEAQALRQHLARFLPEAMMPASLRLLDALPMTPSGKVGRDALRALAAEAATAGAGLRVAPRGPLEAEVAALWAGVLGTAAFGVEDSFFAVGGHSLMAAQLLSRINARFGVALPLRAFFEGPSVAALAARVEAAQREGGAPAPAIARRARVPVPPAPRPGLAPPERPA